MTPFLTVVKIASEWLEEVLFSYDAVESGLVDVEAPGGELTTLSSI